MSCDCHNVDRDTIISFICDEIENLRMFNPWKEYLKTIDDCYKKASCRWIFTNENSRVWFERVLKNIPIEKLIEWAHREKLCVNQLTYIC